MPNFITKIDYDHLVFEPIDEIIVMQQHCGGECIIVYKDYLKPGAEFTFNSYRHSDYPFGLSFYVKGLIDSRISTCCEHKHRHGVRLGGDRGHFAIKSVQGSKPCIKCRFEKKARLKKYAQSPKDKNNENKIAITIPLPVSDEPKAEQAPVTISVKAASNSNENYSEDFEGSDKPKRSTRDEYTTDSSTQRSQTSEQLSKSKDLKPKVPQRSSLIARKKSSRKSSSASDDTSRKETTKKTWEIIFHTSNIPKEKNILLKFSLMSNNQKNETETYQINMKQFIEHFKSDKQYSFPVQLKNIGKPEQIRLKINIIENDDEEEEEEDIKWHLDHIELIDPEIQSHLIFPCKQLIRPLQEKILRLSQESPRHERRRKTSTSSSSSSSSSRQQSPKIEQKPKTSSIRQQSPKNEEKQKTSDRSSTSSNASKTKFNLIRRISPDKQSDEDEKQTPRNHQENKTRYRVIIYPSNDDDGEFNPVRNSRIFLRLNNQTKETNLTRKNDQICPTFQLGEPQTFEIDLIQDPLEKPIKLTIGYHNSDIQAQKWKLQKIVLINLETGDESIFPCKQTLIRNESNFHAEKTFEIQSKESDDESTPRNKQINSPKSDHEEQVKTSEKQQTNDNNRVKSPSIQSPKIDSPISNHEEQIKTPIKAPINGNNKEKSPSFKSMTDDEAHYKHIFKQLDPERKLGLGSRSPSPTSRPKTRRGRQDQTEQQNTTQSVEPLEGFDTLTNRTVRSNDQHNQNSLQSTTTDNTENHFQRWNPAKEDDQ